MSNKSITGRDSYIIAQALNYAVVMMEQSGLLFDEPSNRADMEAILKEISGFSQSQRDQATRIVRALRGDT